MDELKLPPRLNLHESGLCQSERIRVLQQKAHEPAHVAWGTRTKRSVSVFITLFSFVSHVTVPDHEILMHAMFLDHVIKCFEEFNEHYDGTMNQIHFLSFSTDLSSNKVFTYKEAMTQEDAHLFIEAMQKEVADHELQIHWTIVCCSTIPRNAQFRLSACQALSYTVCSWQNATMGHKLLGNIITSSKYGNSRLLVAQIYKLDSKAIDFVLAFSQAELDVDIWMYLPIGFQLIQKMSLNVTSLSSTKAYMD